MNSQRAPQLHLLPIVLQQFYKINVLLLPRGLNLPQELVVVAHALLDPHRRHRLGRLRSQDADRVNTRSDGRRGASWGVLKRNAVLGLQPQLPHCGKVGLRVRLVMGLVKEREREGERGQNRGGQREGGC